MALPNAWPAAGATGWAATLQGNVQYAATLGEGALPGKVGTGQVTASSVVVVAKGAPAPAGLPDGTVIVELSA